MDRGAWPNTVHGVAESDTAETRTKKIILISHCLRLQNRQDQILI